MLKPLLPANELERLHALHRLGILDTPQEERFDRLTRFAQRLFAVPIALITLVDEDRQWFKSCQGLDVPETSRSVSFCAHAILQEETFVIPDTWKDPRFADNPGVTGEPHIRFYAGHPIKASDGSRVGTFCIVDRRPRLLDKSDLRLLRDLATLAEKELNAATVDQGIIDITQNTLQVYNVINSAFECMAEGVVIIAPDARILTVNKAFTRITGYTREEVTGKTPECYLPGQYDRNIYTLLQQDLMDTGYWQGEVWARRKDGELYPVWLSISRVCEQASQECHFLAVFSDLSRLKQQEERLRFLANHDALTGLPNRTAFQALLEEALNQVQQSGHGMVGVLAIGLDRFRGINDSLGHLAGDQVLTAVATRLSASVRDSDWVSRASGDVFNVLLRGSDAFPGEVAQVAQRIQAVFTEPFSFNGHRLYLTVSIGIGGYPLDGQDAQTLLRNADAAMYKAKQAGGNTYRFFAPEMNRDALQNLLLSNDLRQALARNELLLHYQPKVELASGRITGVEALLRWRHPELGLVSPLRFIPLAEEIGVIVPIGEWVIRTACRQARIWQAQGLPPLRMAVNLSARQFRQPDLVPCIAAILSETGIEASCLELEITESMAMQDPEATQRVLLELKGLGVDVALDDFGTGYSSLAYLKRFPIDCLKVDRSFISGIPADTDDIAIARTIIAMARQLELRVVAEGVETKAQRDFLLNEGCEEFQGYLFSKPRTAEEMAALFNGLG